MKGVARENGQVTMEGCSRRFVNNAEEERRKGGKGRYGVSWWFGERVGLPGKLAGKSAGSKSQGRRSGRRAREPNKDQKQPFSGWRGGWFVLLGGVLLLSSGCTWRVVRSVRPRPGPAQVQVSEQAQARVEVRVQIEQGKESGGTATIGALLRRREGASYVMGGSSSKTEPPQRKKAEKFQRQKRAEKRQRTLVGQLRPSVRGVVHVSRVVPLWRQAPRSSTKRKRGAIPHTQGEAGRGSWASPALQKKPLALKKGAASRKLSFSKKTSWQKKGSPSKKASPLKKASPSRKVEVWQAAGACGARKGKGQRGGRGKRGARECATVASARTVSRLVRRLHMVFYDGSSPTKTPPGEFSLKTIPLPRERRFRWALWRHRRRMGGFTWSILKRRGLFEKKMRRLLSSLGLPEELFLLSGVESNYQVRLISRAGAAGVWQFMRRTSRRYGLSTNVWIDERKHIEKATLAAGRYLRALYQRFGRWEFAIAAYNCGAGCVERSIRRCPGYSFWKMRWRRHCKIPWETRQYVARFFAMLYFYRHPEQLKRPVRPLAPVKVVSVMTPGPVRLARVAEALDMPLYDLRFYNPELSSWATPPGRRYPLLVPASYARPLRRYFARKRRGVRLVSVKVRPGMLMRRLAHRYGLTERELRTFNRLWRSKVPTGRRYLLVPLPWRRSRWRRTAPVERFLSAFSRQVRRSYWRHPSGYRVRRPPRCYRVRPGDTLRRLSRRYGISRYRLSRYNGGIRRLSVGMWLRMRRHARCRKQKRTPVLADAS